MSDNKKLASYYRNSAFFIKISKFAAILLFLLFVISCIFIFRRDITVENVQLLAKFITLDGESTDYTDEFSVTVKEDSDAIMLRNYLGIVSNNNISLYDLSGHKLFSYNYSMSSPAAAHDSRYILVYDIGGYEASVFNSFSKIKTLKFDFPIYTADIKGDYIAVVTGNDKSRTRLNVFEFSNLEKDYEQVYTKNFNNYISSVALSASGKYALVSTVSSFDGKYNCILSVYDTESNSENAVATHTTDNELPIRLHMNSNSLDSFVVTDSSIIFLDRKFDTKSIVKFNQSKIEKYYFENDFVALTERNNLSGNSMKISLYTLSGDVANEFVIPDEIYDVSIGKKFIYALGKNNVYKYSISTQEEIKLSSPVEFRYNSIVCDSDDNCYLLSNTLVSRVEF